MIDVDYFKRFNDALGHDAGGHALKKIGKLLQDNSNRPADVAARLGGEEFALLLPDTDADAAMLVVENIRGKLETTAIKHPDSPLGPHLTMSVGIYSAIPTRVKNDYAIMKRQSDLALYQAKHDGRNRTVVMKANIGGLQY